jgi:hypothetical protein
VACDLICVKLDISMFAAATAGTPRLAILSGVKIDDGIDAGASM